MSTLGKFLGLKPVKGDLAYEVEVEFKNRGENLLFERIANQWLVKGDGSLRDFGVEFVSNGPINLDGREAHLKSLIDNMNKYEYNKKSPRTSVHVHVNCTDLTPVQIVMGLFFSWIIEESLIDLCGKERRNNRFCLSIRSAPLLFKNFNTILNAEDFSFNTEIHHFKYANVAYHNLCRIGTLEFRGMEGVYNAGRLAQWGKICYDCVNNPHKMFKNPAEMVDFILAARGNIKNIIEGIDIDYEQAEENIHMMYHLIYGIDWDNYIKASEKAIPIKKKRTLNYGYDNFRPLFVEPGLAPEPVE